VLSVFSAEKLCRLDAIGANTFRADQLMLKLTFFPAEDKMLLEQGGQKAELRRE
jgi:D-alanyl-D-alanine carboxypeptidase